MEEGAEPEQSGLSGCSLAVLEVVDSIPAGRAMTYGDIARYLGLASPRQVGQVLARHGEGVPWHRVVMADGTPAPHKPDEQLRRLRADLTPIRNRRVRLDLARWAPDLSSGP
ncbi:MAG: MGMT family protein [Acidimicrobiales bacterium]